MKRDAGWVLSLATNIIKKNCMFGKWVLPTSFLFANLNFSRTISIPSND